MKKINYSQYPIEMAQIIVFETGYSIDEIKELSDYLIAFVKNNGLDLEDE